MRIVTILKAMSKAGSIIVRGTIHHLIVRPCKGAFVFTKATISFIRNPSQKGRELIAKTIPVMGIITFIGIFRYASEEDKSKLSLMIYLKAIYEGLGGQFLMSGLVNRPITTLGNQVQTLCLPERFLAPSLGKLKLFENKALEMKPNISESLNAEINRLLKEMEMMSQYGESWIEKYEKKLKMLTSLPYKRLPPISKERLHRDIKPKILDLISDAEYNDELKKQIIDFVKEIVNNINSGHGNKSTSIPRVTPTIFQGEAGVGKTSMVERIAEIIGIPCVKKKLANLKNEDIEGSDIYSETPKSGVVAGALLDFEKEAIKNKIPFCTSGILFLDELDKAFNKTKKSSGNVNFLKGHLLDLMNDQVTEYNVQPFNRATVNLEKLIVIGAVNRNFIKDFDSDTDKEAFLSRIRIISLPPLVPKAKMNIGMKYFRNLIKTYENEKQENKLEQENKIEKEKEISLPKKDEGHGLGLEVTINLGVYEPKVKFDSEHFEVVEQIIAHDKRPGVRVMLKVIRAYFNYVKDRDYFEDFGAQEFNIPEVYKNFEQEEDADLEDQDEKEEGEELSKKKSPKKGHKLGSDSDSDEEDHNDHKESKDKSESKSKKDTSTVETKKGKDKQEAKEIKKAKDSKNAKSDVLYSPLLDGLKKRAKQKQHEFVERVKTIKKEQQGKRRQGRPRALSDPNCDISSRHRDEGIKAKQS